MLKVQILDRCSYCKGKALLPMGQANNWKGEVYTVYGKCPICQGTGESARWVSLEDFAKLLADAQCKHEHTAFRGGMHFSAGDVWDDIEEYCIDCGANLDRQTLGDYIDDPQDNHVP
jgi:hypothetical protein